MEKLHCEIQVVSNSNHLQQIYCGLEVLAHQKKISLKQKIIKSSSDYQRNRHVSYGAQSAGLMLIVNNEIKLYYDMSDGHQVDMEYLHWCDYYFKRSFNTSIHNTISTKIKALDLNYMVKLNRITLRGIERALHFSSSKERYKNLLRELDVKSLYSYQPRLNELRAYPDKNHSPKVLFMCRLWDPSEDDFFALTKSQQEDRLAINQMRADCIRLLRKELGNDFFGGVKDTAYARKHFPDIIAPNTATQKKHYINLVKEYPICIATTGLSGSIGWKFGEYMALSRAIVSEKLQSETRGNLVGGINYLEFETAKQCVNRVKSLTDTDVRLKMQQSNKDYYDTYLAPDKLILKSLDYATQASMGLG